MIIILGNYFCTVCFCSIYSFPKFYYQFVTIKINIILMTGLNRYVLTGVISLLITFESSSKNVERPRE